MVATVANNMLKYSKREIESVDIMFIDSIPSLVAVATPLDLVLAVSLKTSYMDKAQRTAVAVKTGLNDMVGTMAGQEFEVTTIYSDGEGAIYLPGESLTWVLLT